MAAAGTRIDDALSVRDGRLWLEQRDLVELAREYGTPLYVISEDQLRRNLARTADAFATAWPHGEVRVLPSLKANLTLAVRRVLTTAGAGCDTFGPGELHAALATGVPPGLISVNGSAKNAALIRRAVAAGARITIDSPAELELAAEAARAEGTVAAIRLRVRPDYDELAGARSDFFADADVRLAAHRYKPGIPTEQALEVGARALALPELRLTGLMAHLGRHSADPAVWSGMASSFAAVVARLCGAWEWRPAELDVGGGFPAPRDPNAPDGGGAEPIATYAEAVAGTLGAELARLGVDPAGVALECEPGRSLHADTGVHLTTVRHTKHQSEPVDWSWVECDTSDVFLADLLVEHVRFPVRVASRMDAEPARRVDVVGISCGFDVLASEVELAAVEPGDVLAFLDTGAYQDAIASNFNGMPRPGTVLVSGDRADLVKRAETVEDVFRRDVLPERLR